MAAPQGLIEYAGINQPLSAQFTLTHGITPSVAIIYCAPQRNIVWKVGPMVISYGGARITFHDCTADKISVEVDQQGFETWAVHVLDRRWKWKETGRISGYYNVRRGTDEIIEGTERTPRELAKLCLEAMGETRFDVSALPEEPRPEIEWDYDLPAEALARLCDDYGCRVTLQLNNSVRIVKAGVGNTLPVDAFATAAGEEPNPPERPDVLIFTAGRTRYQIDLDLEPVGIDEDGDVKPIDELSYIPEVDGTKTWKYVDIPFFNDIEKEDYREFAKQSVFFWYRIKLPNKFKLPGVKDAIEETDRILPLEQEQIETWMVGDRKEPRPAWVFGIFYEGLERVDSNVDKLYQDLSNKPKAIYAGQWELDTATGIVKFGEPVYRLNDDDTSDIYIEPAVLRLRTSFGLRDADNRGWLRREISRKMQGPKAGTLPRYVVRDDVAQQYYYFYSRHGRRLLSNQKEVDRQAKYYLDAAQREYEFNSPASVSYAGFRAINVDGAIQQVTWSVNDDGYAITRASRNREELLIVPTYKERRQFERLREALRKDRETERQKDEKQKKGRA